MTDKPLICTHCGEENLPHATRCWSCGMPLEEAFSIDGLGDKDQLGINIDRNVDDELPSLFRELHEENNHQVKTPKSNNQSADHIEADHEGDNVRQDDGTQDEQKTDWLEKIRKRAKTEDDASGDLIKKVSARDQITTDSDKENVEKEFDQWIDQIRQQARRDDILSTESPHEDVDSKDEEGIPLWLKKLREIKSDEQNQIEEKPKELEKESALPDWLKQKNEQETTLSQEQGNSLYEGVQGSIPPVEGSIADQEEVRKGPEIHQRHDDSNIEKEENEEPCEKVDSDDLKNQIDLEDSDIFPTEDLEPIVPDPYRLVPIEQRQHLDLLRGLINAEGKPSHVQKTPIKSKTKIFRLITALLLLIMTIIPFIGNNSQNSLSGTMHPFSQAFFDNLSTLQKDSHVLLVLDYQPTASAEIEMLSGPVIQQLLDVGSYIYPLTTFPEGLWLADNLFSEIESNANINSVEFLPGGRLGTLNYSMQDFTNEFSGIIKSYALSGIEKMDDFDCIVILVDSLQGGRNWMEQVAPYLNDTKIFMISTEQESALLLPYYDSGQLDGILSGYYDASLFASAVNNRFEYISSWKAYQSGLLVMALLFFVGFIYKLEVSHDSQIKKEKES